MNTGTLAAIDLGTNSFHLVVVETFADGRFEIITTEKSPIRLGSGSSEMGEISNEAMDRGLEALSHFVQISRGYKAKIRAVATSALREAPNNNDFLERVKKDLNLDIEIIAGSEEARLIYLGVMQNLSIHDKQVLVVDIGGGSTEFVIAKFGKPDMAVSLKLGAIRLTNKFFATEPITQKQIQECRQYLQIMLDGLGNKVSRLGFEMAIGSSGTAETLSNMISLNLYNSQRTELDEDLINRDDLSRISKIISDIPEAGKRTSLPGLDPKRADIIVGGVILLEEIFKALDIKEMKISNYALREGVIIDYLDRQNSKQGFALDIRKKSVYHLTRRLLGHQSNKYKSALHCSQLACRIYDLLIMNNIISSEDSIADSNLLEAASLLHNTGMLISHSSHHKHSYYIIKNSDKLLGFTKLDIEIIAQVARYHRKKKPTDKHETFALLPTPAKEKIRILSAILRLAVNMERRHQQKIKDVEIITDNQKIHIFLIPDKGILKRSQSNIDLELWATSNNVDLLQEITGKEVEVSIKE